MSSGTLIQNINDTGDSTGKTYGGSDVISFADSYLQVFLNPNSPSGKISSGLNVEVARFDLKNIGTTDITVNNIFFNVNDINASACKITKKSDANVKTVDESRTFWTCSSILLSGNFDWKTCQSSTIPFYLVIKSNTTLTIKFISDIQYCSPNTYLFFELKEIQYSDGESEFRISSSVKGNPLEF